VEIITVVATVTGSIAAVFQWPEFRWRVLHDPRFKPVPRGFVSGAADSLRPPSPAPPPSNPGNTQKQRQGEWFEIRGVDARASSTLPPSRVASYDPDRAMDGSWSTVWVEGAAGEGVGEWIEIRLGSPVTVWKIGVVNGYGKGPRYRENARIRDAELQFSDGSTQLIHLADSNDLQYFDVRPTTTTGLQLTILSVYPGTRWDDTALGELRLWGKH
jgi:hypothetical protein